jgi:hypothetical protein
LLNITAEGRLQREIKDIIDELDIMINVVKQQEEVITRFTKLAPEILHPFGKPGRVKEGDGTSEPVVILQHSDGTQSKIKLKRNGEVVVSTDNKPSATADGKQPAKDDAVAPNRGGKQPVTDGSSTKQQIEAFDKRAADLLSEISVRINELEGLKKSAETTAQNASSHQALQSRLANFTQVNDLLSVKQQQASVVQAYQAIKQGDETVKQGRAITLFTVMTIIFVRHNFETESRQYLALTHIRSSLYHSCRVCLA